MGSTLAMVSVPERCFMNLRNKAVVTTFPYNNRSSASTVQIAQDRDSATRVAATVRNIQWGAPLPAVTSVAKRGVDILGALVGLAIVGAVIVPIAIAIQLDSAGPVLFRQVRYGYRGRPFYIWKFRSMVPDADAQQHTVKNEASGLIFKNEADPRITRVGRFLRRTSLDELPQFLNVLKGEMSLVGTRPPVLKEVAKYSRRHWQRLAIKPGMTGKWQTSGRSTIKDFEQIVDMDLHYQAHWSLWGDFKIIFKTFTVVLGSKDAC